MDQNSASESVDNTVPSTGSRAVDSDRDRIYRIAVAGLFGDDSRRITERYELRQRIGAGGLGVVYRAYDARLQRDVALKFLRRASTRRSSDLMLREARMLARMSHPSFVPIFDLTTIDDEMVIAMELVDGETLDERLARGVTSRDMLRIMREIGDGLAAAHRAGVVHGDVKPGNVMIDRDGRVRVLDFGLARDVERTVTAEAGVASRGSHPSGTVGFLAPERYDDIVEPASDQFSFCVILYLAAFGRPPLPATATRPTPAALAAIDYGTPAKGRARVPGWLVEVMRRGLAEQPSERFASMNDLVAALRRPARWPAALAFAGVAAAATVTYAALRTDPCKLPDTPLDTEMRKEVLARAPHTSGSDLGAALDTFASDWSASRDETCRAAEPAELALRGACLERIAVAVDGVLRRATRPGFDDWAAVKAVVAQVGRVTACDDREALIDFSQDADPHIADEIQRGIDRAYTSLLFGDVTAYLDQLVELSRTRGDVERAPFASLWLASHLGSALTMCDRPREALDVLRRGLVEAQRRPRWRIVEGTLHVYLSEANASEGDIGAAVFHAEQAIATLASSPDSANLQHIAYRALAIAELARGESSAALAALDVAASMSPPLSHRSGLDNAAAADDLAAAIADAAIANLRGLALADLGRVEEAEASYRSGLARFDALSTRQRVLAQIRHNLGHLLASRGDLDAAREMLQAAFELKQALGLAAAAATTAMDLGNVEVARGQIEVALPWFERALGEGVPAELQADARFNRAIALQQLGRHADALPDYVAVIEHEAKTAVAARRRYGARIGRGTALLALDRTDEARAQLASALDTEPDGAPAYDRAELRFALARTEQSPVRAVELAHEAHEIASRGEATTLVADIARWLAAH